MNYDYEYRVVAVMKDETVVSCTCPTDLNATHIVSEYLQLGAKEIHIRRKLVARNTLVN